MTRKFTESRILIATHNAGKLDEMRQLFARHGVEVVGAAEMDLPEPEETEATFVGNARIKAHAAAKATGMPALADDSGIEVEALDNAPSVYTADWAETENGHDQNAGPAGRKERPPPAPRPLLRDAGAGLARWPRRSLCG